MTRRAVTTHRQTHLVDGRAWWGFAEGGVQCHGEERVIHMESDDDDVTVQPSLSILDNNYQ